MESLFNRVADDLTALTRANEVSALWFSGERSDFVRFNHGKVRQAGRVSQVYASLHLIDGKRHAELCSRSRATRPPTAPRSRAPSTTCAPSWPSSPKTRTSSTPPRSPTPATCAREGSCTPTRPWPR
ncbi:MAG: hypothetical protein R3A52_10575 [Polyangiales bacterium]